MTPITLHYRWALLFAILAPIISTNGCRQSKSETPSMMDTAVVETPEMLRQRLRASEESDPKRYLSINSTWRTPLFGRNHLEVRVSNTATMAIFKDIDIDIHYFSKTLSPVGSQHRVVYEYSRPGTTITTEIVPNIPDGAATFQTIIAGATPVSRVQ